MPKQPDGIDYSTSTFTDGKPHVVSAVDLTRPWGGVPNGKRFRCYLCGHRFQVGDYYRWQYSNGTSGASGNPMVCFDCDTPDLLDKWAAMHREARERFWWFTMEGGG